MELCSYTVCLNYSSMVYSARVVGAVCNCVMGFTNLCVNYTTRADSTLTADVITMCEGASFSNCDMCADLSSALAINTGTSLLKVNSLLFFTAIN